MSAYQEIADGFARRFWSDPACVFDVLQSIDSEPEPEIRLAIWSLLKQQGGTRNGVNYWLEDPSVARSLFREWILGDRSLDARRAAADVLGSQNLRPALDAAEAWKAMPQDLVLDMAHRLATADDSTVRTHLVRALSYYAALDREVGRALVTLAVDPREFSTLRQFALIDLEEAAWVDPVVAQDLRRALRTEADPEVKARIVETLTSGGDRDPGRLDSLRMTLRDMASQDSDPSTRAAAIAGMLDFDRLEVFADIRSFMLKEPSEEARASVAESLGWRVAQDDPLQRDRVELLRATAQGDTSPKVRLAAIGALGSLAKEAGAGNPASAEVREFLLRCSSSDLDQAVRGAAQKLAEALRR